MNEKSSLSDLIARLESATGPDREADLAIQLLIEPEGDIAELMRFRRGLDGKPGMAWDIHHGGSVCFEKYDDSGRCFYNGGYPLPRYTESIDAAMMLAPRHSHVLLNGYNAEGFWHTARVQPFKQEQTPDMAKAGSLPLALCIAALKAHSHTDADALSR